MLSRRRVVLLSLGGLAAGGVAGCGRVPPTPVDPRTASPTPTTASRAPYTATPDQAERLRSLRGTVADARSTAGAWKATSGQVAALEWALGVVDEQLGALGVDAGERPPASGPVPATLVARQLAAHAAHYRVEATSQAAPSAALWAGMAAWCRVMSLAVVAGDVAVQPPGEAKLPAAAAPLDAGNDALAACQAVIYGLPVAIAVPGWSQPDRNAVRARIRGWMRLRDGLADAVTRLPGTPIAPRPVYDARPPVSAAAGRAEVGRLQLAALPHLAVAIDSGPASARPALVSAVGDVTVDLTRWRAPIPRWPGLS